MTINDTDESTDKHTSKHKSDRSLRFGHLINQEAKSKLHLSSNPTEEPFERGRMSGLLGLEPVADTPDVREKWVIEMSEGLEVFLLRTIPRPGLKDNLKVKVKVKKAAIGFVGMSHQSFPPGVVFPVQLWMISCELPKMHANLPILGLARPVTSRDSVTKVTYRSAWTKDHLKFGLSDRSGFVGFRWRSSWPDENILGKRSELSGSELPRSHQVWFSRLGVEVPVPASKTLDLRMQEMLDDLSKLCKTLKDNEFEITYDEVAHIWDLQLFNHKGEPSTKVATIPGNRWITHSNPHQEVHRGLAERLATGTYEWSSDLEFLEPIGVILDSVWKSINSHGSGWLPYGTTGVSGVPFPPMLKLKEWADAIYSMFYLPIVQSIYPALLGDEMIDGPHVDVDTSKLPKKFPAVFRAGLKFFERLNSIAADLKLIDGRLPYQSIKARWSELGKLFIEGFDFRMTSLRNYTAVWVMIKERIQRQLDIVERGFQPSNRVPQDLVELANIKGHLHWSLNDLQRLYTLPQLRFKLVTEIPEFLFAKALNQTNLLGNHTPAALSKGIPPDKLDSIVFTGSFKDILVFMVQEGTSNISQARFCVIQANGTMQTYRIAKERSSGGYRFATYWEGGKLYIAVRDWKDGTYLICYDFTSCIGVSTKKPVLFTRKFPDFMYGPRFDISYPFVDQLSTLITDTIFFIKNSSKQLPTIWGITMTEQGIQDPFEFDWTSYFQSKEFSRFRKFDSRGDFKPFMTITGTVRSQRLFFCMMYPAKPPKRNPITQLEFMLAYFKSYPSKTARSLRLLKKKYFKIDSHLIASDTSNLKHILSVRVFEVGKRDLLLLSCDKGFDFAFGWHKGDLQWFKINGQRGSNLQRLPGTELLQQGANLHHLIRYSYTWCSFLAAEKRSLDIHYLGFSY